MTGETDLAFAELTEVAELIRSRQVTSVEVTEAMLGRIEKLDPRFQSYAYVSADSAMASAMAADAEISAGRYRGLLHGVPVAVKDLCYTTDAPTASGGIINTDFVASEDATVVARLRASGAPLLGKLRMTEGAFTSHHPDLPTPVNPWDKDTWSGVSSSGSGVAPAAGLTFGAIGTDTGGSIRLPSAANGVTGLKPTWGRVSRFGTTALAASMDHVGPMTRSAKDCAAMLQVIAGPDTKDPTAAMVPVPDYLSPGLPLQPRLGVDPQLNETFDEPTRAMLDGVMDTVRSLGWTVIEVKSPDLPMSAHDWGALCSVETAFEHLSTYPEKADQYGPALRDLIETGRAMSAVDYDALMERRRAFTGSMRRLFKAVDLFLLPGTGHASPTVERLEQLGADESLLAALLVPTAPLDISGMPSITMPGGFTDRNTPLGFQFAGDLFSEHLVLQAGMAYQSVTDFHRRHPDITHG